MQLMTHPILSLVQSILRQYGVPEESARQAGLALGRVTAERDDLHRIVRITAPSSTWDFARDGSGVVTAITARFPGRLTEVVLRLTYDANGHVVSVARETRALPGRTVEVL